RYPAFDVIIIDDGSTDGTLGRVSALAGIYGTVRVRVLTKVNGGKATALNTGIAASRTPFVLCMDGDSRLHPDTLQYAMRHFADPTLKLLTAGWHVAYEERAVAYTEAPETYLDLVKQRYRWTRGILQALRKRRAWLRSPRQGLAVWISLLVMLFEAVLWPAMNVVGNLLFTVAAL